MRSRTLGTSAAILMLLLPIIAACGDEQDEPDAAPSATAGDPAATSEDNAGALVFLTWPEADQELVATAVASAPSADPGIPAGSVETGPLVTAGGCLRLDVEAGQQFGGTTPTPQSGINLIWPPGFELDPLGDTYQVLDGDGDDVATVGQEIEVEGIYLAAGTDLSEYTGDPEAARCADIPLYFLVGAVTALS